MAMTFPIGYKIPWFKKAEKDPKWNGVITTMELTSFEYGRLERYLKSVKCWIFNGERTKSVLGSINYYSFNDGDKMLSNALTNVNQAWIYVIGQLMLNYHGTFQRIVVLVDIHSNVPISYIYNFSFLYFYYSKTLRITYDPINNIILIKFHSDDLYFEFIIRDSRKIDIEEMKEYVERYKIKFQIENLETKNSGKTHINILKTPQRMKIFNSRKKDREVNDFYS